jgi:acetyltransferase-like isoleucine patch superfamily enzyme
MGVGVLGFFFRKIGRAHYTDVPFGQLTLNFIVQRIFRVNCTVPYLMHYGSLIQGFQRIKMSGKDSLTCLATKGGCYFTVFEGTTLEIGEGTIWAFNVCIQTGNHIPGSLNGYDVKSVSIGRNCWLANGVAVLAGVTLGDNVVVGANSVVTKSFPSNVIIAGAPAKIIREFQVNN